MSTTSYVALLIIAIATAFNSIALLVHMLRSGL